MELELTIAYQLTFYHFPYLIEKAAGFWNVRGLELPQTLRLRLLRQPIFDKVDDWFFRIGLESASTAPVEFDVSLHGHVLAEVRELDLDQLLGVERAMPVPARAHWLRQHNTSCEYRLQIWYQIETLS